MEKKQDRLSLNPEMLSVDPIAKVDTKSSPCKSSGIGILGTKM